MPSSGQVRLVSQLIYTYVFYFQFQNYLQLSSSLPFFWCRITLTNFLEIVFHLQKFVRSSSIYNFFWGCLPFTLFWGRLPITNFFEVVFHFQVEVRSDRLPFSKICEVVSHLQKCLIFHLHFLRSSFNYKFFEVIFQLQNFLSSSSVFQLRWGRLPFWSYLLLYLPNIVILILRRMVGRSAGRSAGRDRVILRLTQPSWSWSLGWAWQYAK